MICAYKSRSRVCVTFSNNFTCHLIQSFSEKGNIHFLGNFQVIRDISLKCYLFSPYILHPTKFGEAYQFNPLDGCKSHVRIFLVIAHSTHNDNIRYNYSRSNFFLLSTLQLSDLKYKKRHVPKKSHINSQYFAWLP